MKEAVNRNREISHRYFIIAGEASGDLHASNLIRELKRLEPQAEFCCMGGNLMQAQGATLVQHYRNMAYMGVIDVLLHLRKIAANFRLAHQSLLAFKPDAVILTDYPSFNLKIAEFVKKHLPQTPVYYYIPPKIWAWKTHRVHRIGKYTDKVYGIFPFEPAFYARYGYQAEYVGNPTMDSIRMRPNQQQTRAEFTAADLLPDKPIIALLAGSRKHEVEKCLPKMLQAVSSFSEYQPVISGAPGLDVAFYRQFSTEVPVIFGQTYELLQAAMAAVVNSGTATLEAALIGTPQVVVYHIFAGRLVALVKDRMFKIKHFSLVNIIARKEVVKEMIAYLFTVENVRNELSHLLNDMDYRKRMQQDYTSIRTELGEANAAETAARQIVENFRER